MESFRDTIRTAAMGWPAYFQSKKIDSKNVVDRAIQTTLPQILREWSSHSKQYKIVGSSGKVGTITNAPWVAAFDTRITTSAMAGYYVTYLFSVDCKSIVLNIAFGINAFQERVGTGERCYQALRKAAGTYQQLISIDHPNLSREIIDLGATKKQARHFTYQYSSIVSVKYEVDNLPTDMEMERDFRLFLKTYDELVSSPSVPEVEVVVDALVVPSKTVETITACEFEPRSPIREGGIQERSIAVTRRSKLAQKIGRRGEEIVLDFERNRLRDAGFPELADKIQWLAAESKFPGWDISSFEGNGDSRLIEVKACIGENISTIELTANEWAAASKAKKSDSYYIYIVTNVFSSNPKIEIMRNPARLNVEGRISLRPAVFAISLTEKKKPPLPGE